MKYIKMKYKDFEFPSNPSVINVSSKRNVKTNQIISEKSKSENVTLNPIVVTGEGEFFGNDAMQWCFELQRLFGISSAGWLFIPSSFPIVAYFTEFSYGYNAEKNCVFYSFKFVEADTKREEEKSFGYTYALEDENAFDIAYRAGVSVNEIMKLNNFKTPFDINEGDKVMLDENKSKNSK